MPIEYTLLRMSPDDAQLTVDWMTCQYGFDPKEVGEWVAHLHFNWSKSVKAVDAAGNVIGLLNMSDYRVEEETEAIRSEKPELLSRLNGLRYIAVFSFIVAEAYRGTRLNYDMIMSLWPDLQEYDFVFIPVMHRLKTHSYWKRWGAVEFFRDGMSVYYMLPLSPSAKQVAQTL